MVKPIKVIIVDDQSLFRRGLISLLHGFNIEVIAEAEHGDDLLEKLEHYTPDIIIMDIDMGNGMDGAETLEVLYKSHQKIPVIILTQFAEMELAVNFCERGANAFLTKNSDIEVIVQAIKDVVNSGTGMVATEPKKGMFSKRELEIIPLICNGDSNQEIADKLDISVKTVEAHRKNIFSKTESDSLCSFLSKAFCRGLKYLRKRGGGVNFFI